MNSILHDNLTNRSILAKNTIINIVGQLLPLVFAVFSIPILIAAIGTERFGILTLTWVVLGYFGIFDFGISRGLTQLISIKISQKKSSEIPSLIWFSQLILLVLGMLGGIILFTVSHWLVNDVVKIPGYLRPETLNSLYIIAICIPIVITSNALQGVLAAFQRFDLINYIRIPLGIVNYLGPLAILPFTKSIFWIVLVLVAIRALLLIINFIMCASLIPGIFHNINFNMSGKKDLLFFGGWTTVSNIIGSFIINLDRFFIGSFISVAAVAYYTTPFEVAAKLLIIPVSFMSVMFPAFSLTYFSNREKTISYFNKSNKYLFILMFPIYSLMVIFAHGILTLWLGREFADQSSFVLQMLAIGIFINSMSQIPFSLIQGAGRPDISAIIHIIEVPFYIAFLIISINTFSINGAAFVWTARSAIDAVIMYFVAYKLLNNKSSI